MKKQYKLIQGDCLEKLRTMPEGCVDLIITSPPYEDCREYAELKFKLKEGDWVRWLFERTHEMVRVCRGLVAVVVSDKTVDYNWTAATALYIAALKQAGFYLRRPALYVRQGVMGSGGKNWLANRYELIVCLTHTPGPLPYADNTACGHPPKYKPGGPPSNRDKSGKRTLKRRSSKEVQQYKQPTLANPGNIIDCGSNAHWGYSNENEAPFPEKLPSFFIRSFCPPGGIVLDCFCGSSTTGVAALKAGRRYIGIDVRSSQIALSEKRLKALNPGFGF